MPGGSTYYSLTSTHYSFTATNYSRIFKEERSVRVISNMNNYRKAYTQTTLPCTGLRKTLLISLPFQDRGGWVGRKQTILNQNSCGHQREVEESVTMVSTSYHSPSQAGDLGNPSKLTNLLPGSKLLHSYRNHVPRALRTQLLIRMAIYRGTISSCMYLCIPIALDNAPPIPTLHDTPPLFIHSQLTWFNSR